MEHAQTQRKDVSASGVGTDLDPGLVHRRHYYDSVCGTTKVGSYACTYKAWMRRCKYSIPAQDITSNVFRCTAATVLNRNATQKTIAKISSYGWKYMYV